MYQTDAGRLVLSPTDLVAHLECGHLTTLNREVAAGARPRPPRDDPATDVVRRRGDAHEATVLADMRERFRVVEIARSIDPASAEQSTLEAMADGADRIFQATFFDGRWRGHADFLVRNDSRPSSLGPWSYDIADTKLARHLRAPALLQMAVYAQRLEHLQGVPPSTLTVILGNRESISVPYADVGAYARHAMRSFEAWLARPPDTYPVRVPHCAICPWSEQCKQRWKDDDDLVLVPLLRRAQRESFRRAGISTVTALAAAPDDALARVASIGTAPRKRLTTQARLQLTARSQQLPPYEFLTPVELGRGLAILPEPDPGDLFLDLEGDPFFGDHGIEYLWGVSDAADEFTPWWAHSAVEEKQAFEQVVDHIMKLWRDHPGMHVYHYAPYEPDRLKRLSQRYATRVDEVDALLRAERLTDLYAVVRQGLLIGTESYSIKALEQFYAPHSRVGAAVKDAGSSIVEYERWLDVHDQSILDDIEAYNRDDCLSTRLLRDWLEERRAELAATGVDVPRPTDSVEHPDDHHRERDPEVVAVEALLREGMPDDPEARTGEQRASSLLADLLEWHRRENRAEWWEYFRVRRLAVDELEDDPATLGGLHSPELLRTEKRSGVWRYLISPQECRLRPGDRVDHAAVDEGSSVVVALDLERGYVDLKRGLAKQTPHPVGLLPSGPIDAKLPERALLRVGARVATHGITGDGAYRGARDLLLRAAPRLTSGVALAVADESGADALERVAPHLLGALPVQGPPGAGKTFAGSHAIVAMLRAGRTVGITALSHRVITNLLDAVMRVDAGPDSGGVVRAIQKAEGANASAHPRVRVTTSNQDVEAALREGTANLVAGTTWLFARDDVAVDVLVVDEAGQLSLANTVAAASSADAVILLGDPQQLAQPGHGLHPAGADVSALQHALGAHDTIPAGRGLFLDTTWRMHPAVCAPVSELSYESRLHSRAGLEAQRVGGAGPLSGAGLRWIPVPHTGHSVRADEEVEVVARAVDEVLGRPFTAADGTARPIGPADILVVAPYNAQVAQLHAQLDGRARVGTVDKFQGQEAPVVIISLTTSSAADAPRGVDFVANRNRLNVAVSRARALAVLVGSPALLSAPVSSLEQVQGLNALCRLVEATEHDSRGSGSRSRAPEEPDEVRGTDQGGE